MEVLKRWDYKGWMKHVIADPETLESTQTDWNSTLFSSINGVIVELDSREKGGDIVVIIPTRMKGLLDKNIRLLKEGGHPYDKDIIYRDKDDDVIEINGLGIQILNYPQ